MTKLSRGLLIGGILVVSIGVDQLSKWFARELLAHSPPHEYLSGMARVEFAQNTGAFLSLGAGLSEGLRFTIFTVSVAAFLVVATWVLVRKVHMNRMTTIGLALLIGGGVGNLLDRMVFGYVTDFLNLGIGSLRTGIFNIADMVIVAGVLLLAFARNDPPASVRQ